MLVKHFFLHNSLQQYGNVSATLGQQFGNRCLTPCPLRFPVTTNAKDIGGFQRISILITFLVPHASAPSLVGVGEFHAFDALIMFCL